MATRDGNEASGLIISPITAGTSGHFVYFNGASKALGNPNFTYFLAAFDTLGFRYYWSDDEVSFANAPVPAGAYVASTLLVTGRILSPSQG